MTPEVLITLAAAAAGIGLMWFVCIRPMRKMHSSAKAPGTARMDSSTGSGCCASASSPSIEDQLRAARKELQQLRQAENPAEPDSSPSPSNGRGGL